MSDTIVSARLNRGIAHPALGRAVLTLGPEFGHMTVEGHVLRIRKPGSHDIGLPLHWVEVLTYGSNGAETPGTPGSDAPEPTGPESRTSPAEGAKAPAGVPGRGGKGGRGAIPSAAPAGRVEKP